MGGNALRTRETAAAQVGAAPEEIDALVAAGRLRVLATADGTWITTARAVSYAVRARPPRRRARRPQPAPPHQVHAAHAARPATPHPHVAPARVAAAPTLPPPSRAVEADSRTDIAPSHRLDAAAVAAHLGVSREVALRLMQRGRLRATRLGREWITTTRALAEHRGEGAAAG